MSKRKILQLSHSPVVGAPGRVSQALNLHTDYESLWYYCTDYRGAREGMMVENGQPMILDEKEGQNFAQDLAQADIIQIHNFLNRSAVAFIKKHIRSDCRLVYQVRSPHREGPLFVDVPGYLGFEFHAKMAVCQYHLRVYPDYVPTPLIDLDQPSVKQIQPGERPRILYRPSHMRVSPYARWNNKYAKVIDDVLTQMNSDGLIELVFPDKPVPPQELKQMRRECHITIDEISTGAFHTVSLEGLCAGNVVINNSDFFSDMAMAYLCGGICEIPFYHCDEYNFATRMHDLIANPEMIAQLQQRSYDFFKDFMQAERLVRFYSDVYDSLFA